MKKPMELVSFFLLPFAFAVGLILLREKIFIPDESEVLFVIYDPPLPPLQEQIYDSLIVALFTLSLILPIFAFIRNKPVARNEIKLKDI